MLRFTVINYSRRELFATNDVCEAQEVYDEWFLTTDDDVELLVRQNITQ